MPETIEILNKRLQDQYGKFEDGRPNYRIVWSEDQQEMRKMTHTPEGIQLLHPEVRLTRKYGYIKDRYVLEKLVGLREGVETDLVTKTSYEPIWTFEDVIGNPLPPIWEPLKFMIDGLEDLSRGNFNKAKYAETNDAAAKKHQENLQKVQDELFGNESTITDALALDSAVGYGVRNRKDWLN